MLNDCKKGKKKKEEKKLDGKKKRQRPVHLPRTHLEILHCHNQQSTPTLNILLVMSIMSNIKKTWRRRRKHFTSYMYESTNQVRIQPKTE